MTQPPRNPAGPTSFLGGPSLRPQLQAQPARVVEVAPVKTAPIATIDPKGKVYLSLELCRVMGRDALRDGSPIDLRPPSSRNGGVWKLDTRPCAGRRLSVPLVKALPAFLSSYALSPRHFSPQWSKGKRFARLALELEGPDPDTPGLYLLRPNYTHSTLAKDAQPTQDPT